MKTRWIVLGLAGTAMAAAWSAVGIAYFFFEPGVGLWTALVTAAALSLEAFLWVGAGVLGWSFLAGRRAMLEKLRRALSRAGRHPGGD